MLTFMLTSLVIRILGMAANGKASPNDVLMLIGLATIGYLSILLSATLFMSASYLPYAVAASMFVAVILFAHPFGFGLLARLDPSGRILAATPAMMMTGAALGPVLGGTLVKLHGYPAVGVAASTDHLIWSCANAAPALEASAIPGSQGIHTIAVAVDARGPEFLIESLGDGSSELWLGDVSMPAQ